MKRAILTSGAIVLSLAILITFATPALAQQPSDPLPACVPIARWLADEMEVDCGKLMERHSAGVGFGEMMMAYRLAAAFDANMNDMLAIKQSGLGWGQVSHAHALANAGLGLSFSDAVARLQGDPGWDDVRAELGLPDGPPPWAGRPAWAGPPPWAGGPDGAGSDGEDSDAGGPPPWAGGPRGRTGPGRHQQDRP